MPKSNAYNRLKATTTVSTGLVCSFKAAEGPNAVLADGALTETDGTDGILTTAILADADESGGADVQPIFITKTKIIINSTTGEMSLEVKVYEVLGADTDGSLAVAADPKQTYTIPHSQSADTWQTAAGRVRQ